MLELIHYYARLSIHPDYKKLLWDFTNDGNLEMVNYMLSLRNITDSKMEDGTTAFVIALARKDLQLIRVLMASSHPCEINMEKLAMRAIAELDKEDKARFPELRQELVKGLENQKRNQSLNSTFTKFHSGPLFPSGSCHHVRRISAQ